MYDRHSTFVELCLAGEALPQEIDNFVDQWHDGDDPRDINEFLGMTTEEYAIWVERPEALHHILFARKHGMPFTQAIQWREGYANAAGASQDEAREIVKWLKQTGRMANDASKAPG